MTTYWLTGRTVGTIGSAYSSEQNDQSDSDCDLTLNVPDDSPPSMDIGIHDFQLVVGPPWNANTKTMLGSDSDEGKIMVQNGDRENDMDRVIMYLGGMGGKRA